MTRNEMIGILTQDRLNDWVYASNTDMLEDVLFYGWKGYRDYTDGELEECIKDNFDKEDIEALLGQYEQSIEDYKQREEDRKNGVINKLPWDE